MHVVKVIVTSLALVCSGLCFLAARGWSEPLQAVQAHRSAEEELRRMQQRPEEALVLWVPAEADKRPSEIAVAELEPPGKSPPKRIAKAWPKGAMPNLAEAR